MEGVVDQIAAPARGRALDVGRPRVSVVRLLGVGRLLDVVGHRLDVVDRLLDGAHLHDETVDVGGRIQGSSLLDVQIISLCSTLCGCLGILDFASDVI